MSSARLIALGQLEVLAGSLGDQVGFEQRLKVASAAVRLAECDKITVYVHRYENKKPDGVGVE